jgi:hypothetical protein
LEAGGERGGSGVGVTAGGAFSLSERRCVHASQGRINGPPRGSRAASAGSSPSQSLQVEVSAKRWNGRKRCYPWVLAMSKASRTTTTPRTATRSSGPGLQGRPRWHALTTDKAIRRFTSVKQLVQRIDHFVASHNRFANRVAGRHRLFDPGEGDRLCSRISERSAAQSAHVPAKELIRSLKALQASCSLSRKGCSDILVPQGVPPPRGNLADSTVWDFNTGRRGVCGALRTSPRPSSTSRRHPTAR